MRISRKAIAVGAAVLTGLASLGAARSRPRWQRKGDRVYRWVIGGTGIYEGVTGQIRNVVAAPGVIDRTFYLIRPDHN